MSVLDDIKNCAECAKRREALKTWAQGWADWARDPIRNPRPGSKEWLEKAPMNQPPVDSTK